MRRFAPLLLLVVIVSCKDASKRTRCERVCAREADCAASTHAEKPVEVDYGECVDMCNKLERDPALVKGIDEHVACVDRAGDSCPAVLDCP